MFFRVHDLDLKAGRFDVEIAPGIIEYLDPKLRQATPLKAVGKVELVSGSLGEIRVNGHLAVGMEAECDRCLELSSFPIDSDFELYYRPVEEGFGSEEHIIDEGEAHMGFYEGDGLELNEVLREFVLLALPMQRLCKEDCAGICPVCGQSRNNTKCQCQAAPQDDRWAALKNLKR